MRSLYVLPAGTDAVTPPAAAVTRAAALGCSLLIGDPSGAVTLCPSVVVMSSAIAPAVIPDDTGQATLAEVQAAQSAATTAEDAVKAGIATATANLQGAIANLAPGLAQATADAATCAASTDPLAPVLGRCVTQLAAVAQALGDVLVALEIVDASKVPGA